MNKFAVAAAIATAATAAEWGHGGYPGGYGGLGGYAGLSYRPAPQPTICNDGYECQPENDRSNGPSEPVYAKCLLRDPEEEMLLGGSFSFVQYPGQGTQVSGSLWGQLSPGPKGFHIHALGDERGGCNTTGAHFDPDNVGHPMEIGDLEPIVIDYHGDAQYQYLAENIDLWGGRSVLGRALIIHAMEEDETGDAGARLGCCIIGRAANPQAKQPVQQPAYYGNRW